MEAQDTVLDFEDYALRVFGNKDEATIWWTHPCSALGGAIPKDLLGTKAGKTLIYEVLFRIDRGIYT